MVMTVKDVMRTVVIEALLLLLLFVTIHTQADCVPRTQWEGQWTQGSQLKLRVWLEGDGDSTPLNISLTPTSAPHHSLRLALTAHAAHSALLRNGTVVWARRVGVAPGEGWAHLSLARPHAHLLAHGRPATPLLTLPSNFSAYNVTVTASNFTVNCEDGEERGPGSVGALVVIGLVFLGLIVVTGVSSWSQRNPQHSTAGKKRKRALKVTKGSRGELGPLLGSPSPRSPVRFQRSVSGRGSEEGHLWEAVVEGDTQAAAALLTAGRRPDVVEAGRHTSPLVDAHLLARCDLIRLFCQHSSLPLTPPTPTLIKSIMAEWERLVSRVFVAAESGLYNHRDGVDHLLREAQMPATLRDACGRSLLHTMAAVDMDGRPPWEPDDMTHCLTHHLHYPNAVDHWGRTALHELAEQAAAGEGEVVWGGRAVWASHAGLEVARILTEHGCDPRLRDHGGRRPHHLARRNPQLAQFLRQVCHKLGTVKSEAGGRHDELVQAARAGDAMHLVQLLGEGVAPLPARPTQDPLVEAIRHSQREAVLVLLCAGVPLCHRPTADVTPLEAAHHTLGLPAIFPAIIRKEYCDRLEAERQRVAIMKQMELELLEEGIRQYRLQVEEEGSLAQWAYKGLERRNEAQELLSQAAGLGLSLTCQVLGLEGHHTLPRLPTPSPFAAAMAEHHTDTQAVLYRDLRLTPFTGQTPVNQVDLSPVLLEELWHAEMLVLNNIEQHEPLKKLLQEIGLFSSATKKSFKERTPSEVTTSMLHFLAERGLVTLLHTLLSIWENIDINQVVDKCSEATMVHVATSACQPSTVEYLAQRGADLGRACRGGFTPAHLAALTGDPGCYHSLLELTTHSGLDPAVTCSVGLTPAQLWSQYQHMCSSCTFPALTNADALCVVNQEKEEDRAAELLRRKGKLLKINLPKDLIEIVKNFPNSTVIQKVYDRLSSEIITICSHIVDNRFQGKLLASHAAEEEVPRLFMDRMSFVYEVRGLSSQCGDHLLCFRSEEKDGRLTVEVDADCAADFYNCCTFRKLFVDAVREAVSRYQPMCDDISLVPPYLTPSEMGASLHWIWAADGGIRLLQVSLIPVLAAQPYSCCASDQLPPPVSSGDQLPMHVLSFQEDWICRTFDTDNAIFLNLEENRRQVWLVCLLLNQLLESSWWSPKLRSRGRECERWHTRSLGVEPLPGRALKALFLTEVVSAQDWTEKQVFNRAMAVFQRGTQRDLRGRVVPKEQVTSLLPPGHYCAPVPPAVCGILAFLQDLAKAQEKVDKVPKVTFVSPD